VALFQIGVDRINLVSDNFVDLKEWSHGVE
jgi:hypothetical protein